LALLILTTKSEELIEIIAFEESPLFWVLENFVCEELLEYLLSWREMHSDQYLLLWISPQRKRKKKVWYALPSGYVKHVAVFDRPGDDKSSPRLCPQSGADKL
jgi:hypothetical protein